MESLHRQSVELFGYGEALSDSIVHLVWFPITRSTDSSMRSGS